MGTVSHRSIRREHLSFTKLIRMFVVIFLLISLSTTLCASFEHEEDLHDSEDSWFDSVWASLSTFFNNIISFFYGEMELNLDITDINGSSASFICKWTGEEATTLVWFVNGNKVETLSSVEDPSTSELDLVWDSLNLSEGEEVEVSC